MRVRTACAWSVALLLWGGAAFGQQQCTDTSDKCTAFSCQNGPASAGPPFWPIADG